MYPPVAPDHPEVKLYPSSPKKGPPEAEILEFEVINSLTALIIIFPPALSPVIDPDP